MVSMTADKKYATADKRPSVCFAAVSLERRAERALHVFFRRFSAVSAPHTPEESLHQA